MKIRIISKPECGSFSYDKNYNVKEKDDGQYLIKDDNGFFKWIASKYVIEN